MRRLLPLFVLILAGCALILDGCGSGEEGFRAEAVPTKAEIDKKMQTVKDNPNIPDGAKSGILAGLEKQRETAK